VIELRRSCSTDGAIGVLNEYFNCAELNCANNVISGFSAHVIWQAIRHQRTLPCRPSAPLNAVSHHASTRSAPVCVGYERRGAYRPAKVKVSVPDLGVHADTL